MCFLEASHSASEKSAKQVGDFKLVWKSFGKYRRRSRMGSAYRELEVGMASYYSIRGWLVKIRVTSR